MKKTIEIKGKWKDKNKIEEFVEECTPFGFKTAEEFIDRAIEFYLDTHRVPINDNNEIELPRDVLNKLGRNPGDYIIFRIDDNNEVTLE